MSVFCSIRALLSEPGIPMRQPAAQVLLVLEVCLVLVAAWLVLVLARYRAASGLSWRAWLGRHLAPLRRPLRGLLAVLALLAAAELLLPAEVTPAEIDVHRPLDGSTAQVVYGTCCTGGGVERCEVPLQQGLVRGQSVLVHRSRILDRCRIEPVPGPPPPCHCR